MKISDNICIAPECGRRAKTKEMCQAHYQRVKRGHPDPFGTIGRPNDHIRAKPKINYNGLVDEWLRLNSAECIIWPFYRGQRGYGKVTVDRVCHTASRFVCMRVHGEAPGPNYEAAHECGNGHVGCVNPKHIVWKTRVMNAHDRKIHSLLPDRPQRLKKGATKNRVLEVEEVLSIKARLASDTFDEIASSFNVPRETIWRIAKGRTFGSVGAA